MAGERADQHRGDEFGRRLPVIGDGRRALRRVERRAVEVFADDARRARFPVKDRANLVFEQRALLLDDDDELEPLGEVAHNDRVERPNHADFEEAEAKRGAVVGDAGLPSACKRSCQALPAATTPILASAPSPMMRLRPLRAHRRARPAVYDCRAAPPAQPGGRRPAR